MKFISVSLIIFFMAIANAFSADDISEEKENEKKELPTETQTSTKEDNSLNNRSNKKYQLTVGMGNEYSITAYLYNAAYFIDSSQVITFRYSTITNEVESEALSNELNRLRAYTFGYKKFLGNSFNIQPTLYYRKSSTDYVNEGSIRSVGTPNIIYDDIGMGFRIGNEWQWDNFVLGVDRIG